MSKTTNDLQGILYEASQILERAKLISAGAPYWMICDDAFADIFIDGAEAVLRWPEVASGYYDSCSIETQSVSFPSSLLLMSVEQIKEWSIQERAKYEEAEATKRLLAEKQHAERQVAMELHALAVLKAKYEKT